VAGLLLAAVVMAATSSAVPSPPADPAGPEGILERTGRLGFVTQRAPFPPALGPVRRGRVVSVHLTVANAEIELVPGTIYKEAWAFNGGVPGPTIHVRQGQTVKVTLTNAGDIPHSIDFHAARIAPSRAFRDVAPGESFTYSFKATTPGVFVYHCGSHPLIQHVANGMYGAIVVDPAKPRPKADREYVLVASEWYMDDPVGPGPASYSHPKAVAATPDWTAFNGYPGQYLNRPLTARPGRLVRLYVANAGPNRETAFHVVGAIFDRVFPGGGRALTKLQTWSVPPGGGAVFELTLPGTGFYPFVSHLLASEEQGQVGILKVGHPPGEPLG
jgi:nitrite reductase (NO-forming)